MACIPEFALMVYCVRMVLFWTKAKKRRRRWWVLTPSTPAVPNCGCWKGPAPYWSDPTHRGVYPTGIGRAISHIFKSGGLTEWSFGLRILDRLLLVVALGILVMPIVKKRFFETSVTVCLCKQHIAQYFGNTDNHIKVSKSQGQRVRLCLYIRPKQCEVCFIVSDVGGWSPIHSGGLDAPEPTYYF